MVQQQIQFNNSKSLKNQLLNHIRVSGRVRLSDLEGIAKTGGYKISNMERRMRELTMDNLVSPIRNNKSYIIGYEFNSLTQKV